MSIIRGQLNVNATVYTVDRATLTAGRQPIEQLVLPGTGIKCAFKPKKTFLYYLTGQVMESNDIIITERALVLNNVVFVDGLYYRIVKVQTLRGPGGRGRAIIGYSAKVEPWRH